MQVETENKLMTIVEVAKALKCSQSKLQRFVKAGLLNRHQGVRRGARGVIPYFINVDEARALIEDKTKSKTKAYKKINVNLTEEVYQKIVAISDSTGFSLNAIGKKVFDMNLDKVIDSLYEKRPLQEVFIEKLQKTFKATSAFGLTKACNEFQQTVRKCINGIFRNEEDAPKFNIVTNFVADENTNALNGVKIDIYLHATMTQMANEHFKAFFENFNINTKLLFEALLRGQITPNIIQTDLAGAIAKNATHTVTITDNGMIV